MFTLAFIPNLGWPEILILLFLGLLIFGRRLPEVGRSLGRGIVEFKKGIKGLEEEIESESGRPGRAPASRAPLPETSPSMSQIPQGEAPPQEDVRVSRADKID